MNSTYIIIAVVLIVMILGAIMAPKFAQRKNSQRLQNHFGTEYDHTLETMGNEKEAHAELEARRKRVKALNIRPLSASERERFQARWTALQAKFIDQPGQATIEADQLIAQAMQLRGYPEAEFEQRAADISVNYAGLMADYRAAHETAMRNENQHAGTEDLRLAMISYRTLFNELIKTEEVVKTEKVVKTEAAPTAAAQTETIVEAEIVEAEDEDVPERV